MFERSHGVISYLSKYHIYILFKRILFLLRQVIPSDSIVLSPQFIFNQIARPDDSIPPTSNNKPNRYTDMNRNDPSGKDVIDQISRADAKAVVAEVRQILDRTLKNSERSSTEQIPVNSSSLPYSKDADQSTKSTATCTKNVKVPYTNGSDEKLAFTIEKDSETYKGIYSMVEWYRDSYLVGEEFADRRKDEKNKKVSIRTFNTLGYDPKKFAEISNKIFNHNITSLFERQHNIYPKPSEFTGLGYPFLTDYVEWYVKSNYAIDLLRPTATWLASTDGPMFQPALQSLAGTIPMMQETTNDAMRYNILWMLQDKEWKDWAKSLTTQYVYRSREDE